MIVKDQTYLLFLKVSRIQIMQMQSYKAMQLLKKWYAELAKCFWRRGVVIITTTTVAQLHSI